MKPSCSNFEAKKASNFIELPPVGAYVAEIQAVRFKEKNEAENVYRDTIELMIEITDGEYKNRYHEVYENQKERFGDDVKYKGVFRLIPYTDDDEDWRKRSFQSNLWCVQQSNPGYAWDWNEQKLKGKKIGINVRAYMYTYNGKDYETTEIGKFETIADVQNGKCKPMRPRDRRENKDDEEPSADGPEFTEVSGSEVNVPWR